MDYVAFFVLSFLVFFIYFHFSSPRFLFSEKLALQCLVDWLPAKEGMDRHF
jgi:hypothetical protein